MAVPACLVALHAPIVPPLHVDTRNNMYMYNVMVNLLQSTVHQDVDYENELDLLHAVVTLPSRDGDGTEAWFCFLDDRTGEIIKKLIFIITNLENCK